MNDPLSPLTAPPPRYLLESDSSDEEGQGLYHHEGLGLAGDDPRQYTSAKRPNSTPTTTLTWAAGDSASKPSFDEILVATGQAGRYIFRKSGLPKGGIPILEVIVEGKKVSIGRGYSLGKSLIIVMDEEPVNHEECWSIAQCLLAELPSGWKWTVLSTYVPAMYIPGASSTSRSRSSNEAPIREMSILGNSSSNQQGAGEGLAEWESPNYLTGLAAAVASLTTHPSQTSQTSLSSMSILILPLPLSSITTSTLQKAFQQITTSLNNTISETSKNKDPKSKTTWTEADDENYIAPGMGSKKSKHGRGETKVDIGTMYM